MRKLVLLSQAFSLFFLVACSGNTKTTSDQTEESSQENDQVVVKINETTFPDDAFRSIILSKDYGSDGILTKSELDNVKKLLVGINKIENLKGIEYFTALEQLDCSMNKLTNLDISSLHQLETLSCYNNSLTKLDLSNNTNLKILYCGQNKLSKLDVSHCPQITLVSIVECQIKGDAMDELIQSLPKANTSSIYYFICCGHERRQETNKWTNKQLKEVRAKGWTPYDMRGKEL